MWVTKIRLINVRGFEKADIEFSKKLNILIGPNNCGKSTILHSILSLQKNSLSNGDIKLRKNESSVDIFFDDFSQSFIKFNEKRFQFYRYNLRDNSRQIIDKNSNTNFMQDPIPSTEPLNFIYPYLSKRKVALYNETVNHVTAEVKMHSDFRNKAV
jgi:predicted ATP-dependent endonuclease of OLD family